MRVEGRVLAAWAIVLAGPGCQADDLPASETPSRLQSIVSEAQRVQGTDVRAWVRYRFGRRAEREELDETGQVETREDLEFVVTPDTDGFREELLRHNGAEASDQEKQELLRSASFNKHYRTLIAGDEGEARGGYSVGQLLHLASYRYVGQETIHGVACYRLDFQPGDVEPLTGGLAARFTRAMQGSLWITVEGFHLAAARAETVRPITILPALSKVYNLAVQMESGPVGDGVWLPMRVQVDSRARILFKSINRRNRFTYSDFSRIVPPA